MIPEKVAANEAIRRRQHEIGLIDSDRLPYFCECDDPLCRAIVRLRPPEYAEARARGDRCIVAKGHPYTGRVVIDRGEYVVAEP